MKKEIRLMLDYQCYPIWIYDEQVNFIDNSFIDEIEKDNDMLYMLNELQDKFDSLYLNTKEEFKYIGFTSEIERKNFEKHVEKVYKGLCELLNGKYIVKNMVNLKDI